MFDFSEKEHCDNFDKFIKLFEGDGHEVVCYKETYDDAKCLIDGWAIDLSHYAEDAKSYYDAFLKPMLANAEKLRSMGVAERDIDKPKFKKVRAMLAKAKEENGNAR